MRGVAGGQESERYRAAFDVRSLIQRIADGVDLGRAVDDRPVDLARHGPRSPVLTRQSKSGAIFRLVFQLNFERTPVLGRNGCRAENFGAQLFEEGRTKADGRNATRR